MLVVVRQTLLASFFLITAVLPGDPVSGPEIGDSCQLDLEHEAEAIRGMFSDRIRPRRTSLTYTGTDEAEAWALFLEEDGTRVVQKSILYRENGSWFADYEFLRTCRGVRTREILNHQKIQPPVSEENIFASNSARIGDKYVGWVSDIHELNILYGLTNQEISAAVRAVQGVRRLNDANQRLLLRSYLTANSRSALQSAKMAWENLGLERRLIESRLLNAMQIAHGTNHRFESEPFDCFCDALDVLRQRGFADRVKAIETLAIGQISANVTVID
jgi:hypothetical protein